MGHRVKYIINNTVVFSPGEGLYLATSDTVEFKLSLIADNILLLLITFVGVTVSKKEIHDYLWKESSLDVSGASINNNISHLRRFFKEMGVSDFIITTPKVGVSIRQGTIIESVPINIEEERGNSHSSHPNAMTADSKKPSLTKWGIGGGIGMILSLISLILLSYYNTSDPIDYIGNVKTCKVFALDKLSAVESESLKEDVSIFIDNEKISCPEGKVIIANSQRKGLKYIRGNRAFFAECEINKNHLFSCDSYYYLGGVG